MSEHFSPRRFSLLLRNQIVASYRSVITASLTLALLHLFFAFMADESNQGFYISSFGLMLYLFGVILSSRSFTELHDKTRNIFYLLLPASSLEKTLARLLTVTLGLFIYLLLLSSVVSAIIELLRYLFLGRFHALFNPLDPAIWSMLPGYFLVQSTFFLGAAWFRSGQLIKTTLTICLTGLGLIIFSWLTMKLVLQPYWGDMQSLADAAQTLFSTHSALFNAILYGLAVLWVLVCWSIAWLRLKETQVCDGV